MSSKDVRHGSLEVWIDDPVHAEPLPLNGPWSRVNGPSGSVELPPELHSRLLEELESVIASLPLNQVEEGGFEIDALYARTRMANMRPHCLDCATPLPDQAIEQDRGIRCTSCGAESNVMPVPWWLSTRVPSGAQIIGSQRVPSSYGQPAIRWFVRFEGEPAQPELMLEPQTEEEALAQLGIIEDPKELRRAMRFATDGGRKQDLERQIDVLAQRAKVFETQAAAKARPWAMFAAMLSGVAAPVALFPGLVFGMERSGNLPLQGDPTLILEAVSLLALIVVVPGLVVAQNALRIWGGISKREAFNQVGFYAVLALIPALGLLVALARAVPLMQGRLPHASVKDGRDRLMRPWPVNEWVPVGWAGIPTAVILLAWGLGVQLMWAGLFL